LATTSKSKNGRPSLYTKELTLKICELIAHGMPLTKICKMPDMPGYQTILDWLNREDEPYKGFSGMYARAREDQADTLADEIIEIADDSSEDTTTDPQGNPRMDSEWVQRSRLRVDARKWIAAKLKPRKYGEKVEQTLKGDKENPVLIINAGPNPYSK
jgi:hypothetical protein